MTAAERRLGDAGVPMECLACGRRLEEVADDITHGQPTGGLRFFSRGAYGTTVFDPMDGSHLLVILCDDCVVRGARAGRVFTGRYEGGRVISENIGWWPPPRRPRNGHAGAAASREGGSSDGPAAGPVGTGRLGAVPDGTRMGADSTPHASAREGDR